jgi:Phasin protein
MEYRISPLSGLGSYGVNVPRQNRPVDVTSPSEFIEVSTKHARHQFQAMSQQTRELAELAQKAAIESMGPFATGLGGVLLGRPDLS